MIEAKYSVLMSVYHKENPEHLRESINSMLNQTVKPDEIILVKDGPLTDELEKIIKDYQVEPLLYVIELKENVGLGIALNIGLKKCRNEIIARMDSDDVSDSLRCETQLKSFEDSSISVVGSSVAEFIGNTDNVIAYKGIVEKHDQIANRMKYQNPMNHPTVMFRKKDVESVGGYKHWYLNEDYYLWIRMLEKGYRFQNINKQLVKMRITDETYMRRGGWKYFITQKHLFDYMLKNNIIGYKDYFYNNAVRFIARVLIPNKMRKILYLRFLRDLNN